MTHVDTVEAVSDEVLARLVKQKTLTEPEAQSLGLGVSLHRLTAGNLRLVSTMLASEFPSVKTGKLQHARDLALLEPQDWERALTEARVPVPSGVVPKDYARRLAINAVAEFPQAALKQRTTRLPGGLDDTLKEIQPLLETNSRALLHDFATLNLKGVNEAERKLFQGAHARLQRFANLHPGLDLHNVLSKPGEDRALRDVEERVGWLSTVFELNPDVSFLNLDYLPDSSDLGTVKFGSLPDDARELVLADLKAHQRVYSVANNPIPAVEILEAGFDSASAIALAGRSDFREKTALPDFEAQAYYATALDLANAAASRWIRLYDVARDKTTTPIRAIPSAADFFMPLKGFAALINEQPWCNCEHCQSVLSPAAYFVDLMYYIEQHILKDSFSNGRETDTLHLHVRRRDLWDLELTCKNTDEYVPYLDVVNEVLERYVWETLPRPVGATFTKYLYQHLADSTGSFQQPFTLPIERLETLLAHFGVSRYDIVTAMGSDRPLQARARLKISRKEWDLITIERISTTAENLAFFKQLFKLEHAISASSADAVLDPIDMPIFLKATSLAHEMVKAVLHSTFVNADGSTNAKIIVVTGKRTKDDVQNNTELVTNVTVRRLDRIHRFVRLWRKLPWTVDELDYVLSRLASPDPAGRINAGTLESILDLLELNETWSLPIDELMALSDAFPPIGLREATSLFDRLFNQPPFRDRDGQWPPPAGAFVHPAWKRKDNSQGKSDPNNNTLTRLLAGLQVGDKELIILIGSLAATLDYHAATATADESISLSEKSIGILYRHARLMRLLETTSTDLDTLITLTPRMGGATRSLVDRYIRDRQDVIGIVEYAAWQRASGFSLAEIVYMTRGQRSEGFVDPDDLVGEIVSSVKRDKRLEFADTVFTQIGLTDVQSRKIVLDNLDKTEAFERLPDGVSYRLRAGFDPVDESACRWRARDQSPQAVPPGPCPRYCARRRGQLVTRGDERTSRAGLCTVGTGRRRDCASHQTRG